MKYIKLKTGEILKVYHWEVDEDRQLNYYTTDKGIYDSSEIVDHAETKEELL